ncbi:MAG: DUF4231 domain-containing protein [Anaerolinea sp.]|nr:DUF4231 domain-containing protein [Anaerolinea sp.]
MQQQRKPQPDDEEKLGRQSQVKAAPDENTFSYRSQPPTPQSAQAAPTVSQYGGKRSAFLKELPFFGRFPRPDPSFALISEWQLEDLFNQNDIPPDVQEKIRADLRFLDAELMPAFRERDYQAKLSQNRVRSSPLIYSLIGTLEIMMAILVASSLDSNPALVPIWAFIGTVLAVTAITLITVSNREAPVRMWLTNRARAEALRREHFRYLLNLAPYDRVQGYQRRALLSRRAAQINRGVAPS